MHRRNFLHHSSLATAAMMLSGNELFKPIRPLGVQLYSIRDFIDKDVVGTLQKVSAMGYREIEGFRYAEGKIHGYTPAAWVSLLNPLGLHMPSIHCMIDPQHSDGKGITDLAKRMIDDLALAGTQYLICPSMHVQDRNRDSLLHLCDIFNRMGEACTSMGLRFGYHNHDFEFAQIGGGYLMDVLLNNTDPFHMDWQMDLYWVHYGHQEPIDWLNRYPGRVTSFHVKDMANTPERETIEVGEGMLDFKSIFRHPGAYAVKHYIVELEHYRTTSLDGVNTSFNNLRRMVKKL